MCAKSNKSDIPPKRSPREGRAPAAPLTSAASLSTDVDGLKLHYLAWGDSGKPCVVLLHSLSGYAGSWSRVAAHLADRFYVLAPDCRGFGQSDRDPERNYNFDTDATDLEAVLSDAGINSATIVGHSRGARVALAFAERHAAMVDRLILVDGGPAYEAAGLERLRRRIAGEPTTFSSREEAADVVGPEFGLGSREEFDDWLSGYLRPTAAGLELLRDPWFAEGFRRLLSGVAGDQRPPDFWRLWSALEVPVLLIWGSESTMISGDLVKEMRLRNPEMMLCEVEDVGHNVPGLAPRRVAEAIREFVHQA